MDDLIKIKDKVEALREKHGEDWEAIGKELASEFEIPEEIAAKFSEYSDKVHVSLFLL